VLSPVCVVGPGRVGTAVAGRLAQRGLAVSTTGRELACGDAELVLLCVPDAAIVAVARSVPVGPWVAHVSGATRLAALDPHTRRFALHPLQTIVRGRGPEQLDGAYAAVTGETAEALATARELARLLGLSPFELADEARPLYHAAAGFGAQAVVALWRVASSLMERCDAPPQALVPLIRRTVDNGFELTGPVARGDWVTLERNLEAIRRARPEAEPLFRELVRALDPAAAERLPPAR
jgi:predicted short-subunit dehydrogenase-like oxidoreductase (DUF2520 family)